MFQRGPRRQQPNRYMRPEPQVKGTKMNRFSTSLDTVQQVLGVVHSTAPYIEKYGPLVQKLPSIYRIYQAMKNIDIPESTEQEQTELPSNPERAKKKAQPNSEYPSPTLYI